MSGARHDLRREARPNPIAPLLALDPGDARQDGWLQSHAYCAWVGAAKIQCAESSNASFKPKATPPTPTDAAGQKDE